MFQRRLDVFWLDAKFALEVWAVGYAAGFEFSDYCLIFLVAFEEEFEAHDGVFFDVGVVAVVLGAGENCVDTAVFTDLVLDERGFPDEAGEDEDD